MTSDSTETFKSEDRRQWRTFWDFDCSELSDILNKVKICSEQDNKFVPRYLFPKEIEEIVSERDGKFFFLTVKKIKV